MAALATLLNLNEKYGEKNYLKAQTSACCIYCFEFLSVWKQLTSLLNLRQ